MVSTCETCTPRILLVEEDQDVIAITTLFLAGEGYSVDTANDAEHGVFKACNGDYDAILVSEMLSKRDGWFVFREIRRKKEHVPILMLTFGKPLETRYGQLSTNTVDYLLKPFTRTDLLSRLRTLGQRESHIAEMRIEFGSVSLDRKSQTVIVDGRIVSLTAREYSLLELLASRRGGLVSRTEIYDLLSDHFDASLTNLVDVYVCNIRRKLGIDLITTRRGCGYIMNACSQ